MARIVRFHETGGPEVLRLDQVPERDPGPGEVRLKVEAIGLNRAEVMLREGVYHERPIFPSRIGYEAAGVVDALGDGVTNVKQGDRVATVPSFALSQTRHGVYGESAVVPAEVALPYPASLSPIQGAAIWMQYLTAYGALVHYGHLGPGDVALITAASSSVGVAAIQIAKQRGACVIATTRHATKKQALQDIGADHIVATEEEDLAARVMEITDGAGARIALDPIAGPMLKVLCAAAAPHGTIFEYGALHPSETVYPLMPMLAKSLTIVGYQVLDFVLDPERFSAARDYIFSGLESGALAPVIDRTFPLEQIVEAHRHMESNTQCGKIVVTV
ncbi:MAG: Quinone oxidoreductase 1 [Alphaproteobacteria bacterium MarineAlpha10_Bin1]|jgi:NADPH:quinone reductase-like Zn-dependent oxidoreductase|nr:MAG: Quinone oxidoreductase 1 [Alphaproteobacteria bacterium MarineAlpha10_Bin1]